MDINKPRTFTVELNVPVRGLTARHANEIRQLLAEQLPELASTREVENFHIVLVASNTERTIYFRFGTTLHIVFTAYGLAEELVLLKGDIEERLAGISIDYPKMERPDIRISWVERTDHGHRSFELTLVNEAEGELESTAVARTS